ncbi:tRNA dihydrouridine synthase DusB [Actinopolymorpha rutila]|uniref:NifR3 family TIM-barrel protein n=1 Tax=Actinopolymorpha rutila TaxID=446787 RepID=A0A852ZH17_9ACTN|nr:tRNA dihydrouridine synthase DusB [Actinopolymorpha rutila]NYH90952.1 nifR3 family TIM-barrel protein [Actinopolymorpha rutila]
MTATTATSAASDTFGPRSAADTTPTAFRLGSSTVSPPVVLAPMAGVTNAAYRTLCREQGQAFVPGSGPDAPTGSSPSSPPPSSGGEQPLAGVYVCEMITSRGLAEGDETTKRMLVFDPGETVRSVQLYGVDPTYIGRATEILCGDYGVGHVDLNFGCPVPKVTRRGGGAVLPWKRNLLGAILRSAVAAAAPYGVPVTMKTRKGIDDDHLTFLEAGQIAQDSGCAAIALHGRTAAQHYSGQADWDSIAALAASVDIPVLGNGDIWEAEDAVRMVRETGCSGVVVGRGCLGRPWLFRDLAAAFGALPSPALPGLGEVAAMMRRHAELLAGYVGEDRGCREFRKHVSWYLKGFPVRQQVRRDLGLVSDLAGLDALLAELDHDQPFPVGELGLARGRQGSPRSVTMPAGWLDDRDGLGEDLAGAELGISGG